MSKYIIKYRKIGYLKYISHLDIMRLFHRSFKRAKIKLKYSNGYNPHPKMVIAQPLSLGYESTAEYLEIDTCEDWDAKDIIRKINIILPTGIELIFCKHLENFSKTLAAMVEYAEYEIVLSFDSRINQEYLDEFSNMSEILVEKFQHKTNSTKLIDIKPLIHKFEYDIKENNIKIITTLRTGSSQNLNPELLILGLLQSSGIASKDLLEGITRTEIFFEKDKIITPIEEIS